MAQAKVELQTLKGEFENSARLLVRRDVELSSLNERLRELDRAKSGFVSIVAHQLRTPLSAVKWVIKMVLDGDVGPLNPEQREFLHKGYDSNERMIRLINDMLDVVQIESGKLRYELGAVQIEELIHDVLLEFVGLLQQKHLKLTLDLPNSPLPPVYGDAGKIRIVLQNLIDNAMKYTPERGRVTIRCRPEGPALKVIVEDSGIGIPDHQQTQVFTRFFRGDNAIKMETDGSGLGLFIIKNIVEHLGGKIWFTSQENAGSTFTFTVPRA